MPAPPDNPDTALLWDVHDAARSIEEFVRGMTFEQYAESKIVRSAVERQFEIIGEAAGRLSERLRIETGDAIPWSKIIRQRHVLAHEYGSIRQELLWRVATVHIAELISALGPFLCDRPRP